MTDASAQVTDTYSYDAFGLLLNRSGATENHYMYTGEQYDANVGFYYLRARYYNPAIGRFHTMDTWPGMQFEPMSLHKYLYCESGPVGKWDPSGKMSGIGLFIGLVMTIAIIGILASIVQPIGEKSKKPIKWNGHIAAIAYSHWAEEGMIHTILRSEPNEDGESCVGIYLILVGGVTPLPIPVAISLGNINLESPGKLGPKSWVLVGGVQYASAVAGPVSVSPYFKMGWGIDKGGAPEIFQYFGLSAGVGSGLSFYTGGPPSIEPNNTPTVTCLDGTQFKGGQSGGSGVSAGF